MEEKWKYDLLNREKEGKFIIEYLINRYKEDKEKPFVLNINAEWGYGKTFFLNNIAKELREKNHHVIEFDSWKNDYTKEPLLAFMSEINNSLESFFTPKQSKGRKFLKAIKDSSLPILMSILSRKLTGYTLDEILDNEDNNQEEHISEVNNTKKDLEQNVSSLTTKLTEYALKEHNTIKNSVSKFKINIKRLLNYIDKNLKNKKLPLFILIDELDRCRPTYAIELLESIKHLFDIEGIVFIIATDTKQLSHSINAIYGNNFASEKYLKRFFDQEYSLIVPDNFQYIDSLFEQNNLKNDEIFFTPFLNQFSQDKCKHVILMNMFVTETNLNPREINHVVTVLKAVRLNWLKLTNIQLPYLLFLIFLKIIDNELFQKYKVSKDIKPTLKIFEITRNNTSFTTMIRKDHSSLIEKKKTLSDLIEYYDNLSRTNIDSIIKNNSPCEVFRMIDRNYIDNINTLRDQDEKFSLLNSYFDLVMYAGQIK
jgi:hypothetical protein